MIATHSGNGNHVVLAETSSLLLAAATPKPPRSDRRDASRAPQVGARTASPAYSASRNTKQGPVVGRRRIFCGWLPSDP